MSQMTHPGNLGLPVAPEIIGLLVCQGTPSGDISLSSSDTGQDGLFK